jgi:DNA-binding NarL/FixJ family response regulator
MTTFVVADDFAILRQGVLRAIATLPSFRLLGEAANGNDLLELVIKERPDVVVTDIGMAGLSVFDAMREIRRRLPRTRIVFLSMYDDEAYVAKAVELKASFIIKDIPPVELIQVLPRIVQGEVYYSPQVRQHLAEIREMRPVSDDPAAVLTRREREVLKMLAEGNACKEIAILLGLSLKTIETHKFNIMKKLAFHNRVDLVNFAYREGMLPCPNANRCEGHVCITAKTLQRTSAVGA